MKKKRYLIAVMAVAAMVALTGASCSLKQTDNSNDSSTAQEQTEQVAVVFNFGPANKEQKQFTTSVSEKGTAFDALKQIADENKINITYSSSTLGVYITEIDGVKSTNDQFWLVYVNDKSIEVAADKQDLNKDDKVEFRFEGLK